MEHANQLESLQKSIGHDFRDLSLLERALIAGDSNAIDQEGHRGIAQLGDSLIGTVLFSEGLLRGLSRKVLQDASSRMRSKSVCGNLARCLKLDLYVKMSERQDHIGPQPTTLKNTLAALIGATWLDTFNYDIVVRVMNCMGLLNYPAFSSFEHCIPDDTLVELDLLDPVGSEMDFSSLLTDEIDLFSSASTAVPSTWSVDHASPQVVAKTIDQGVTSLGAGSDGRLATFAPDSVDACVIEQILSSYAEAAARSPKAAAISFSPRVSTGSSRLSKQGKIIKPQPKPRRNSAKYVFQEYITSEMEKMQTVPWKPFQQMMLSYESLVFKSPAAQQASMAYFVTSIGDSSALLLLKEALRSLRDPDSSSCFIVEQPMSIAERLLAIDRTGSLTSQLRLVRWLHILSLHEQLDRAESIDGFVNNFTRTMAVQSLSADTPAPDSDQIVKIDPRLRRFSKRLALMVDVWGRGVLLLLGQRFTEERFMSPTDKVFDELLGLLNQQEGGSIKAIAKAADPVVKAFQKREIAAPKLMLEEISDDNIRLLSRLSAQFSSLLAPVVSSSSDVPG